MCAASSLNHLVGAGDQRRWKLEAERAPFGDGLRGNEHTLHHIIAHLIAGASTWLRRRMMPLASRRLRPPEWAPGTVARNVRLRGILSCESECSSS
jgi:hypothetical protein